MQGETVTLHYETTVTETDPFGDDSYEIVDTVIDNVLVQPGVPEDDIGSNRPDGVDIKYTLYFPKKYVYGIDTKIFRGAKMTVRGVDYDVVGVPDAYDSVNTPTEWAMQTHVGKIDG